MNKIEPADFIQQLSRSRIYQDYEQAFERATKLPLELSSFDMWRQINRVRSKYANPFCAILARTSKICGACLEIQRKLSSANTSDTQTVTCFAGLTTTSVLVKSEKRVIAFLHTGQVFLRTPTAKRFKKIATRLISWGIKVNFARIEKAENLLHSKELRITDIAYEVGFQSLTHFNRIFGKLVGHSPTEYRSTVMETP